VAPVVAFVPIATVQYGVGGSGNFKRAKSKFLTSFWYVTGTGVPPFLEKTCAVIDATLKFGVGRITWSAVSTYPLSDTINPVP
jgi:hypothetical protein